MASATEPQELERLAERLNQDGGTGFLLSGGSTSSGKVPLARFTDAISRIRQSTSLRINVHVGLMPPQELSGLVEAGVDAFCVDVYGTDAPISETLGLKASAEDYLKVLTDLIDLDAPLVVPHLCVGIHEGRIEGEFAAIDMLSDMNLNAAVILVLAPTRGTPYARLEAPTMDEVLSVIGYARERLAGARLNLGCMRPRGVRSLEVKAAYAGVDGIAVPSKATERKLLGDGWNIIEKETCCAFE